MTLDAAAQMRRSPSLKQRIESAAYAQGQSMQWVDRNVASICATPEWAAAWAPKYTEAVMDGQRDPDLGSRLSVISDDMIAAAVKATVDAEPDPATPATPTVTQDQLILLVSQLNAKVEALEAQVATQAPADGTPA